MVQINIDPNYNPADNDYDPTEKREYPQLPRAWYSAYIDESIMKDTNDKKAGLNDHEYLQLRFILMDWADSRPMPMDIKPNGRKFWGIYNIRNSNAQAVEIAYRELKDIGHASGVMGSNVDTSLLHDKPLEIFLEEITDNKGKPGNKIVAYRACNSGGNELKQVAHVEQATQAGQATNTPPKKQVWE